MGWKTYVHPRAGLLYVPGTEVLETNMLDFWHVSRANRWGFLDRPPPPVVPEGAELAEPSCRVAVVGDSFVEAMEVPISDKLHVRLEELARENVPGLHIQASAYGHSGMGQINQLGYYDEFVSRTAPRVVVLVFVHNDFVENAPPLLAYRKQVGQSVTAARDDDGFELRLPTPSTAAAQPEFAAGASPPFAALRRIARPVVSASYALGMLRAKIAAMRTPMSKMERWPWLKTIRYTHWFGNWKDWHGRKIDFAIRKLPADGREALEHTGFALDQWKARARRDDFALVILAAHTMGSTRGSLLFEILSDLASAREIPVVDQSAHILRRNGRIRDAHWAHDAHWNAAGHQWAAEAVLEWLRQNQEACASSDASPDGADPDGRTTGVVEPSSD